MRQTPQKVCNCRAVSGPHIEGLKGCIAKHKGPFCGQCGMPCQVIVERLEFNDRTLTSSCCGGSVYDDASLRIQLRD